MNIRTAVIKPERLAYKRLPASLRGLPPVVEPLGGLVERRLRTAGEVYTAEEKMTASIVCAEGRKGRQGRHVSKQDDARLR